MCYLFQIPITLHKESVLDHEGREVHRCGFKIGGGIDQDFRKSPQNYSDNVSYLSSNTGCKDFTVFLLSIFFREFMSLKYKKIAQVRECNNLLL
jgi:hypothetical protein